VPFGWGDLMSRVRAFAAMGLGLGGRALAIRSGRLALTEVTNGLP